MRGTLTALVVVLLVASGVWAAPASAAAGAAPVSGTAPDGNGFETVPTVTPPAPNGTDGNTTNSTDLSDGTDTTSSTDTTDSTDTINTSDDGTTTNVTDDGTVNESVTDGTTSGSVGAEAGTGDDPTADATVNGSVSGASVDAELATNGSGVTVSATADGGDAVAVSGSVDATVDTEVDLLGTSTTSDATVTTGAGTPTPAERSGENASAGAGGDGAADPGSGGDVPAAASGAVLVGFGAAAVTLLARRSATVAALGPNVAATVSRLRAPLAQLWDTARRWLPRVLAAVGYSRYDDSDPLTHATRAELYDLIAESPGTYLSELSERADVPTSTVRHHLDVLVNEGVVTTANVRGRRRYFSLDAGNEALAAALEDDASAAVIDCLARTGPASVSTIAEELDRDVSTVSHHLGRLAEDDLVEREREGRSVYSELTPEVEDALGADGSGREPPRA